MTEYIYRSGSRGAVGGLPLEGVDVGQTHQLTRVLGVLQLSQEVLAVLGPREWTP